MKTTLVCLTLWIGLTNAVPPADNRCVDDIPSRAVRADMVVDGRIRGRHSSVDAWNVQGSVAESSYFNVSVRPRRVLKGWLQRNHDGTGYIPVVVGPFAVAEDRDHCVPGVTVGARYVLFLSGNGSTVSRGRTKAQPTTLFFQLAGFPARYTSDTASLARQYSCSGCSK